MFELYKIKIYEFEYGKTGFGILYPELVGRYSKSAGTRSPGPTVDLHVLIRSKFKEELRSNDPNQYSPLP